MSSDEKNGAIGCITIIIVVIGIYFLVNYLNDNTSSKTKKTSSTAVKTATVNPKKHIIGADPHAFASALELYEHKDIQKISDDEWPEVLSSLQSGIKKHTLPEETNFRNLLLDLDGGPAEEVFSEIAGIGNNYNSTIRNLPRNFSKGNKEFINGNSEYVRGNFEQAADYYIKALSYTPSYLDARNNLGLCDLHLGNNVSAAFNFYLVSKYTTSYLGAAQNLSVALERMGLRDEAYEYVLMVSSNSKLPMGQYNRGWFEMQNGKFAKSENFFKSAINLYDGYDKAKSSLALAKLADGETLSKDEEVYLSSLNPETTATPAIKSPTPNKTQISQSKTETDGQKDKEEPSESLIQWWWWALWVAGVITQIGLTIRADMNIREGTKVWGIISTIGLIVAIIVFAALFNSSLVFAWILWILMGLNIIILIPTSAF